MQIWPLVVLVVCLAGIATAQTGPDWYTFTPKNDPAAGEIGMNDWLEKPAGKYGRIQMQGEKLMYAGKPIKLWGLNLCYGSCSPSKEVADKRAAFYPKFGINTVRMHKWIDGSGWSGIQSPDSVAEFDPAGLDRFDYQFAKLKEAGIYMNLSQAFGTIKMGPKDVRDVPYAEEFGKFDDKNKRVGGGNSTLYYSPEMQQLTIRQLVNLLKHKNPYTGLTYAEDPAVAYIEIVNESSILFFSSMNPLKQSPTLRKMTGERFSKWLKEKYGTQEALEKAWGKEAFDSFEYEKFPKVGEHIDKGNILPLGNPWYWAPANLNGSQAFRKQRLLDSMEFLTLLQNECYDRIVKALRWAGYQGEILGSNWQAGEAYSHFANLHSDALLGTVDRHNYFGGNGSMLQRAGMGMLSSGLQQVDNRPFMLSEWIHTYPAGNNAVPNEWGAEGPAIIGAYGMGLQGWDVSYMFQNGDSGGFSASVGGSVWDVTAPQVLGVFPAVARQVLRGDVTPSELQAVRNVHVPSLFEGKLSLTEKVKQGYDDKEIDSDKVPARALAVARTPVCFTDDYQETPAFDLTPFEKDGFLLSSTGQLAWKEGGEKKQAGFFTMNTGATKAVVGFAKGQACALGEMTITPDSDFAAIYVSAQGKDETIATAKKLVVVAMARARNTGEVIAEDGKLTAKGKAPVLLEPVKAAISLRGREVARIVALDHDGKLTETTLPVENGAFTIDGAKEKTPYYLVELK